MATDEEEIDELQADLTKIMEVLEKMQKDDDKEDRDDTMKHEMLVEMLRTGPGAGGARGINDDERYDISNTRRFSMCNSRCEPSRLSQGAYCGCPDKA